MWFCIANELSDAGVRMQCIPDVQAHEFNAIVANLPRMRVEEQKGFRLSNTTFLFKFADGAYVGKEIPAHV